MNSQKPIESNPILLYYEAIQDGSVIVGEYVRKIYEIILEWCKEGICYYDEEKSKRAIEWIESHCFHTEGPLAPQHITLELWEKAFIAVIFGIINNETKVRQFQEVLLVIARKNGKSLLASAIANYMFQIDGGFGARIYNIAPKLAQADIIYNNVWMMIQLDPAWKKLKKEIEDSGDSHHKRKDDSDLIKIRRSDLYFPKTNSTMTKIAFNAKKSDGFNPSLAICDEIASWEGDSGLKQYEVMRSGMGARPEGLLVSCTTSGYINDSIYDELMARSTKFLKGDSKETRLFPLIYMIEDLEKWNDMDELQKSNPNLGISVSKDFLTSEIAVAEGSASKKAEFMCKYCNIKQNSSMAWLDTKDVMQSCGEAIDLEQFRGCYSVMGIDLSQTTDLTAVTTIVEKDGRLYTFSKFFMPEAKVIDRETEDKVPYRIYNQRGFIEWSGENYIEYSDAYNYIFELINKYEIYPLKIGYDRYSAQYLIKDLKAIGCQCDDVYQGENLTPVINETEGLIKDGAFYFGDNDLLKIHLLNSALKVNNETNRKRLVKISRFDRIDGMAALLDAMCVRQKYSEEIGALLKNEGK